MWIEHEEWLDGWEGPYHTLPFTTICELERTDAH